MKKTLTIVIPSYNTEKYMDECLPTILNIKNREKLEILLINDGSTDGTLTKANCYMEQYPECVRVIDKENGGHGSVINRGILEATGKYFKIIDGDDWVISENLNMLLNTLEKVDADLVVNSFLRHNEQTGKESEVKFSLAAERCLKFDEQQLESMEFSIHAVTYKTELLKDNHLSFREKCFYEDSEYILYPIKYVQTIQYNDFPVYIYRVGTATQSINPERAFRNRNMHHLIATDCLAFQLNNQNEMSENKRNYCAAIVERRVRSQYAIYFKSQFDDSVITEVQKWDDELKAMSEVFYRKADVFPISFLRKNIRKNAKWVWYMFKAYFKIKEKSF